MVPFEAAELDRGGTDGGRPSSWSARPLGRKPVSDGRGEQPTATGPDRRSGVEGGDRPRPPAGHQPATGSDGRAGPASVPARGVEGGAGGQRRVVNGADRHCAAANHSPIPSARQPTPTTTDTATRPGHARWPVAEQCAGAGEAHPRQRRVGDAIGSPSTVAAKRRCRSASRRVDQTTPTNSRMPRPAARVAGTGQRQGQQDRHGIPIATPTARWPSSPPMPPTSCRMVAILPAARCSRLPRRLRVPTRSTLVRYGSESMAQAPGLFLVPAPRGPGPPPSGACVIVP